MLPAREMKSHFPRGHGKGYKHSWSVWTSATNARASQNDYRHRGHRVGNALVPYLHSLFYSRTRLSARGLLARWSNPHHDVPCGRVFPPSPTPIPHSYVAKYENCSLSYLFVLQHTTRSRMERKLMKRKTVDRCELKSRRHFSCKMIKPSSSNIGGTSDVCL